MVEDIWRIKQSGSGENVALFVVPLALKTKQNSMNKLDKKHETFFECWNVTDE